MTHNNIQSRWKPLCKAAGILRAVLVGIVLLGLPMLAHAGTATTYFYKASANVEQPTGGGLVYVSNSNQYSTSDLRTSSSISTTEVQGAEGYADLTLYYHAQSAAGYGFEGWYNESTLLSTNLNYTASGLRVTSDDRNSPTSFDYTAHFRKLEATVFGVSTNTARGTVVVNPADNYSGKEVTLVALPDEASGVRFLGWKTSDSESDVYVSTNNPLTVTATNEVVTYYAFFTEPAATVYCILENATTGRILSLYGDGAATAHTRTFKSDTAQDGFIFTNGLKMLSPDEAKANPLTVFKRSSVTYQGKATGTLATDVTMENSGMSTAISFSALLNKSYDLIFDLLDNGNFNIYIKDFEVGSGDNKLNLNTYLRDPGTSDTPTMETTYQLDDVTGTEWKVYFLTEEQVEGAFGAFAKESFTQDGKYYTSMYAPFAYKLLDGVKAYYLDVKEENYRYDEDTQTYYVKATPIATGSVIPANTAVIIECPTYYGDPTKNRLLPVDASEASPDLVSALVNNQLKGVTELYSKAQKKVVTTNTGLYDYVFGRRNEKLGFYRYAETTLPSGKAYVQLTDYIENLVEKLNNEAKNISFLFSDSGTSGIISSQVADVSDDNYYDLQGRRVVTPGKGIYIHKGKKIVKR